MRYRWDEYFYPTGSTAKMLGQAVISLTRDYSNSDTKLGREGGFWTPATMFDGRYIERLTRFAGLQFKVLEENE